MRSAGPELLLHSGGKPLDSGINNAEEVKRKKGNGSGKITERYIMAMVSNDEIRTGCQVIFKQNNSPLF